MSIPVSSLCQNSVVNSNPPNVTGVLSNVVPKEGGRCIPFQVSFTYNPIQLIDLSLSTNSGSLEQLRGLYIDCTQCFDDVIIYFPETGFEYICKSGNARLISVINMRYNYRFYVKMASGIRSSINVVNIIATNMMFAPFDTYQLFHPTTPPLSYIFFSPQSQRSQTIQCKNMNPISLSGYGNAVQSVIICGVNTTYPYQTSAWFSISYVSVVGILPSVLKKFSSASFSQAGNNNIADSACLLSPDKNNIALYCLSSSPNLYKLCVFNIISQKFTSILSLSVNYATVFNSITWLDNSHFVFLDGISINNLGLRLIYYDGSSLYDLGYRQIWPNTIEYGSGWGIGSIPYQNGAIFFARSKTSTTLYGIFVYLSNGAINHGSVFTVYANMPLGSGSGAHSYFIDTSKAYPISNAGEFTWCYGTVLGLGCFSFIPSQNGVTITRSFTQFAPDVGVGSTQLCMFYNTYQPILVWIENGINDMSYRINIIELGVASFIYVLIDVAIPNLPNSWNYFSGIPIDKQRFIMIAPDGDGFLQDRMMYTIVNLTNL